MDETFEVGDKVRIGNGKTIWEIFFIAPTLPWAMLNSTEGYQHRSENLSNLTKVVE